MNEHTDIATGFAFGKGQRETHAAILSSGRPNPSKLAGQPYSLITGKKIIEMATAPRSVPKDTASWFIPSSYAAPDARSHDAQRQNGQFFWLPVDVDQNDLSLDEVRDAVHRVVPGATYLIYSSRSATPDNRKWRILVPLKSSIAGTDYRDTVIAFYELLETASGGALKPDHALARPGQLIYLPNEGEFYAHEFHDAEPLDLNEMHPIIKRREETRAAEASREFARRKGRGRLHLPAVSNSDITPVSQFIDNHSIANLLARYGYKQAGQSNDWRSPMQTSESFATRDFGSYWLSLSASDAAAGIGRATPAGHRYGDAFDLYVHFEKNGDFSTAVRDYAVESGIHNDLGSSQSLATADKPADAATGEEFGGDEHEAPAPEEVAPKEQPPDWPFKVNARGVWKRHDHVDRATGAVIPRWETVCSELHVLGDTRDADGEEWGRLLEIVDRDGRRKLWAMPMSLMSGDGSAIRERLFSLGLVPGHTRGARQALLEYISSAQPEQRVRCVSQIGWCDGAFVLPTQTIGVICNE